MISLDSKTASTPLSATLSRRIAVRPYSAGDQSSVLDTTRIIRRRASSSSSGGLTKRRSVSSMRGLMPLSLPSTYSTPTSTSSSPTMAEERMVNNVDGYFPEVLAQDLELSTAVFNSRNMTSGTPEPDLTVEDKTRSLSSYWSHRSFSSPYHATPGSGRPLGPIQERNSVISFDEDEDMKSDDSMSDGSISGTDISRGPNAQSISYREQSIITAATSLSSSCWMPSPRNSPLGTRPRELSWIEPDSEDEDHNLMGEPEQENVAALSPRPPTPPESDPDAEAAPSFREQTPPRHLHRKSFSISGGTPLAMPRRHRSRRRSESLSQPVTVSAVESMNQSRTPRSRSHTPSNPTERERSSAFQTPRNQLRRALSARNRPSKDMAKPSPKARNEPDFDDLDMMSDDEEQSYQANRATTRSPVYIRPSPPPSPLPSVEFWLNGAAGQYTAQCPGDDLTKAVPLPPNVVETLRVSIACFPETMLLTSSLTVETIRHYSKKVRQPSADLTENLAPDSPMEGSRRSLWKRVVSYKRGAHPSPANRSPSSGTSNCHQSPRAATPEASRSWVSLKNVFGSCSDYICDALWAHIVAYNYISALVPRTTPQRKSSHGRHGRSGRDSQQEEIPKKAASLLGLAVTQDASGGVDRVAKLGSQLPWGPRDGMVPEQTRRSVTYDNATKDIQAGLMRCIMRLIATAKLMAEGGSTDDSVVEIETRGVDILFTRSLCEIVRVAEEAA